ncbi:MAG: homoserine dehydrogenase [Phycisphaerales bacterium]|nr:homoserine dehydrogenase [Phycisphaerales bacterium]
MRIVLSGFGVVAQAFTRLLEERGAELYEAHGVTPRIVAAIDRGGAAVSDRGLSGEALLGAKESDGSVAGVPDHGARGIDAISVIRDIDADLLIEATPSVMRDPGPAMERIKSAFAHGMHVVSVNKAPLAVATPALLELARYNRVEFRFSGTVGAGTPMLATLRQISRGDRIERVRAILNGTTNYILSRMHDEGADFDIVLQDAIRLGYAETDPSADIDGIDAATKVVILANVALGRPLTIDQLRIEGIRDMSRERVESAHSRGMRLKLIGEIGADVGVSVQEVPADSPLNVGGSLNALSLSLRYNGEVTLIGRGAGGVETATAVLRDTLDIWDSVGERA